MLQALIGAIFGVGLFLIFSDCFRVPFFRTSKAINNVAKRQEKKTSTLDIWLGDLAMWISKKLRLNEFKRMQLEIDLRSAGVNMSPEMHIANSIVKSMLIGILATTLIGIPMGITEFKGFVSAPESIAPIFCKFEWSHIWSLDMFVVVFTFLFIDLFDTMGTLIGVCTKADMMDQKTGRIPRLKQAFLADAIATTVGAVLGTSTTTTYVESAAGVAQGGRSGLTALVIACCFAVTLFLSPLFLSIPSAATAPVLILVGLLMIEPVTKIDFVNFTESIPAFICIIMMPLAYSVSDGILTGMIFYVAINMASGKLKRVTPTMFILAVLFILKYIFF